MIGKRMRLPLDAWEAMSKKRKAAQDIDKSVNLLTNAVRV